MNMNKSFAERCFQAVTFEVLAIIISAPLLVWLMGVPIAHAGLLTLMISLLAMTWNVIFNALFDKIEQRLGLVRTFRVRAVHAVGFEAGLIVTVVPLAAWWLDISLFDAFLLDIGVVLFFLPYTFLFNLGYDKLRVIVLKKRLASA
jgi:uncharacterized membrane protein